MEFDLVVVGLGIEGSLKAAKAAAGIEGKRVLHVGRIDERYGGQHMTYKGIDSIPLLLSPSGPLANDLIEMGTVEYVSFAPVQTITCFTRTGKPLKVPFKKEHIMLESSISLLDKRRLMSFIESFREFDDASFDQMLAKSALSDDVVDLIKYGICFLKSAEDNLPDLKLREKIEKYFKSLPQPFLYPLHGSSEICQALVRTSAVHGAVQLLNQRDHVSQFEYEGKPIDVQAMDVVKCDVYDQKCAHACLVNQVSLFGESGVRMYVFAPNDTFKSTLFILQLDESTLCLKSPGFLIHFWSYQISIEELKARLDELFNDIGIVEKLTFETVDCNLDFDY